MVNQIDLNKKKNTKIDIVDVTPPRGRDGETDEAGEQHAKAEQLALEYGFDDFRDAMYARIVKKVGERAYLEDWASRVADIAQTHITRISGLLHESLEARTRFETFINGLRGNLNESIVEDEAIEMLAQHLVTRPVFEALFAGYDFTAHNPVAQTMEAMLAYLDERALESENATLEGFYDSVRRLVTDVDSAEGRQKVLVELYNNFFAKAFKKTVDKLGIVYTPVEIVDFLLRSADEVLRAEFGQSLSDESVHILDGFTGTGTFIVRLLQLGLLDPHDVARKYATEIHANEILLLAYYIAAVNIETTYADITGEAAPFPGLVLTDTFQSYEDGDRQDLDIFPENNERITRQRALPITVIVGNPPYRGSQESSNDDNANQSYPSLDEAIRTSYVARSSASLKNKLYDPYIRAIKWALLRIEKGAGRGVIAFVTNGSWLSDNVYDGMRQSLVEEFSSVHVFNLRGNQYIGGERSRREGGKVFNSGSRATIAITVLVKNPDKSGPATVLYTDVGDYLSREQKLAQVSTARAISGLQSALITPNKEGDWISKRNAQFDDFLALEEIFQTGSLGVSTNRDAWVSNFGRAGLTRSVCVMIDTFNRVLAADSIGERVETKLSEISWSDSLRRQRRTRKPLAFDDSVKCLSLYRPFTRKWLYLDRRIVDRPGSANDFFTEGTGDGYAIGVLRPNGRTPFAVLAMDTVPNLSLFMDPATCFGRYRYDAVDPDDGTFDFWEDDSAEVVGHLRRVDNITDMALSRFVDAYPDEKPTKDDIFFYTYGLLHSPEYREAYAADLTKSLPRVPFVHDFRAYADAGRALAEVHLNYESIEPYPLEGIDAKPAGGADPYAFYAVGNKKMKFGKPTAEQKAAGEKLDRSTIYYNDRITVSGIPETAYDYQLGSRSALEWIMDRYYIKTEPQSDIEDNPNDWSRETGDPRYILDLLARVVTVSVETMKIIEKLPSLKVLNGSTAQ